MKKTSFFFLFVISSLITTAQSVRQKIDNSLAALLKDEQLKYASVGMTVLNAKTGETVYSRNPDMGLAPASTLKTITSITALSILGEDYRYKTQIGYSGTIDHNGTLNGDLIIKGGGDPTLASWRYEDTKEEIIIAKIVAAVKQAGIKRINGSVVADDSVFPSQTLPDGWIWQDIGNYYGAGASGLTWRENQYDLVLKPGISVGSETQLISTKPAMNYLKFKNELKTGAKGVGDDAYVFLPPYGELGYLRGEVGVDEKTLTISGSLPDPAYECAYRIKTALEQQLLDFKVEITTARRLQIEEKPVPAIATTLTEIQSPALGKIIYWFDRKSVNLYGEHLVKTIAMEEGKEASTSNGITIEKDFWSEQGIDKNALNIADGSGLSPGNRVTTAAMARILHYAFHQPWFNTFNTSLPDINGLKMKDGYINGVRSYAGYVNSKDGNTYVFSFIVNNFSGSPKSAREKMWRVIDQLK